MPSFRQIQALERDSDCLLQWNSEISEWSWSQNSVFDCESPKQPIAKIKVASYVLSLVAYVEKPKEVTKVIWKPENELRREQNLTRKLSKVHLIFGFLNSAVIVDSSLSPNYCISCRYQRAETNGTTWKSKKVDPTPRSVFRQKWKNWVLEFFFEILRFCVH